ncbi:MAG: hypothetical protein EKK47_17505 [Burkholderiales bacterium]|nr:MAG: hypothetical protein EKK47_17505 [Burkholderiales bacterium]
MSIEQTNTIDFVDVNGETGDVWLTISDHLRWGDNDGRHLSMLQEKLNSYLRFVESGELLERFPEARGRKVVFNVACKHPLNEIAQNFVRLATPAVIQAGYSLQFKVLDDYQSALH